MKKLFLLVLSISLIMAAVFTPSKSMCAVVQIQQAVCIDGSGSISDSDFDLLKEGLASAVEDQDVMPQNGSVELTVIQFGYPSPTLAVVEVQPTVITSQLVADNIAATIRAMPKGDWNTPMAAAIDSAKAKITGSLNFPMANRQVINISTNGYPYPEDPATTLAARDAAVAAGINLVCAEAVQDADLVWLRDYLVWPQPGVEAPPYPDPPGSIGFVREVLTFADYAEAIEEKLKFVVNDPPLCSIVPSGPFSIFEGDYLTFVVTGTDPNAGDIVTITSTPLPSGAGMDPVLPVSGPNTGISSTFKWTPGSGQAGNYPITFTITDDRGKFVECSVYIKVDPRGLPILSQWGLWLLILLIVGTGVLIMLRRKKATAS